LEGKDNIKELFSQKLGNYEAPVNPELWAKISSQVAAGATTTAATGLSLFTKIVIGVGVSAAAIATVVVLSTNKSDEVPVEKSTIEVKEDTKNSSETLDGQSNSTQQTATLSETQTDVSPNVTPNQHSPVRLNPPIGESATSIKGALKVDELPFRDPQQLNGAGTTPHIIEGVTYIGGENVDATSENQTASQESAGAKTEPIKRFVNVFTPNGDGENDVFFLESEGLTDFSIVVFDPNGEIVYKSSDANFKWDGRDIRTNELVPSGNYMYMVSAYDSDKNPYPIYESLRIISN
jgi:gliding motility-associated-like protein